MFFEDNTQQKVSLARCRPYSQNFTTVRKQLVIAHWSTSPLPKKSHPILTEVSGLHFTSFTPVRLDSSKCFSEITLPRDLKRDYFIYYSSQQQSGSKPEYPSSGPKWGPLLWPTSPFHSFSQIPSPGVAWAKLPLALAAWPHMAWGELPVAKAPALQAGSNGSMSQIWLADHRLLTPDLV